MAEPDIFGVSLRDYQDLLLKIRNATSAFVFSGAGLSAESGIPTYRDDPKGMWARLNPQDYASVDGFSRNPVGVWRWYWDRKEEVLDCEPNPAHLEVARLQQVLPAHVVTQNVDGLLTRAGCSHVHEMHGNLFSYKCLDCERTPTSFSSFQRDVVPECTHCGGWIRPSVVWFGETLDVAPHLEAELHATRMDLFISVGTSGDVHPASTLPVRAAHAGKTLVIINPAVTAHDALTPFVFRGRAGQVLPKLLTDAGLL